jgi:prevent-host-death family protein
MKSIDEAEANRLPDLLEEAQRGPITIQREGTDLAVLLSFTTYTRLRETIVQTFSISAGQSLPKRKQMV